MRYGRAGMGWEASACKLRHQLGDGIENVVANQRLLIEQAGVFNESLKGLAVLAGGPPELRAGGAGNFDDRFLVFEAGDGPVVPAVLQTQRGIDLGAKIQDQSLLILI